MPESREQEATRELAEEKLTELTLTAAQIRAMTELMETVNVGDGYIAITQDEKEQAIEARIGQESYAIMFDGYSIRVDPH